jgi:hypothetical protein
MSSNSSSSGSASASISTSGLLGVLFVGLKLTGYIHWPWLWVTAPFWIPLAILLAVFAFAGVVLFLIYLLDKIK